MKVLLIQSLPKANNTLFNNAFPPGMLFEVIRISKRNIWFLKYPLSILKDSAYPFPIYDYEQYCFKVIEKDENESTSD